MDAPGDRPELVVLVGLQASGKTTFCRRHLAATHVHVSKDAWPNARRRNERQRRVIDEALAQGHPVAVDNTNASPAERAPLVALARAHGVPAVAMYFPTSMEAALERNRGRTGRARIPVAGIHATARRLSPPRAAEGFDRRYQVRIAVSGEFDVEEWPP